MTDLYHLFQELETAEIFELHEEYNRIKAEISKRGNFQRLKFNHEKIADEVYHLQRAHDGEITTYINGVKTVENYLEYEFRTGRRKHPEPLLKYIIRN